MMKNYKQKLINDAENSMSGHMLLIGATPEMSSLIIDAVKAMVESAYMNGRIDRSIEVNEELEK